MADDNIITVTIKLNPGSSEADAKNIARQITAELEKIKPDLSKSIQINPEMAKRPAKAFADTLSNELKTNISAAIGDAFSGVDLSKTGFGKNLEEVINKAVAGHAPSARHSRDQEREEPAFDLTKRIQPFLSGIEALSLLMRGAPISSIAQMAGQTFRDFNELRRERERTREFFPSGGGGGGGPPRTPSVISERTAGAMSAAEAGAAGAGGLGLAKMLGIGGGIVAGAGAAGLAMYELSKTTVELAKRGADTTLSWEGLRKTMGITKEQFGALAVDFAKGGLSIDESHHALSRLALIARREMPEITKKIEDYGNVSEESGIKVRDAERATTKTHLDQQAAAEHLHETEGELVKVQTTGADVRAQQFKAAALAVTAARQSESHVDTRNLLGIAGARLGVKGADLSVEAAQARFAQLASGEREDPEAARARALQQAQHGVEAAQLAAKQARLHLQETKEEAPQAREQADLRVQQAETAKRRLEIDQEYITHQDQINKAVRAGEEAQLAVLGGPDRAAEARIAQERLIRQREREKYEQIPPVQAQLERLSRGEPLAEGYEFGRITPTALREALISGGGGTGGGVFDFGKRVFQGLGGAGLPDEQQKVIEALFRSRTGSTEADKISRVFAQPIGAPRTHEELEEERRVAARLTPEKVGEARKTEEQIGISELTAAINRLVTAQTIGPKTLGGALSVVDTVDTGLSNVATSAASAAEQLGNLAGKISGFLTGAPKGGGGEGKEVTTPEAKAGGGLLSGPGSETSDSIPINASRGEFIINAERTRKLGVPFLNDLNEGRVGFQTGGPLTEEERRKRAAEDRAKYLKSIGYRAPGAFHPGLAGYGGDQDKAATPAPAAIQDDGRALRAGMLRVSPEYAQAYLAKLRSGATPTTAVTRENPFFGKTPEQQAAMMPTGPGVRGFDPKFPGYRENKFYRGPDANIPLPPDRPDRPMTGTLSDQFALRFPPSRPGEMQGLPDQRAWTERSIHELLTMARGDTSPREEHRGGLRQFQEMASRRTEPPTSETMESYIRLLKTPAPIPGVETALKTFESTPKEIYKKLTDTYDESKTVAQTAALKAASWGAWGAKYVLPKLGVAVPAAAEAALGVASPVSTLLSAGATLYGISHQHETMPLGDVLKEQRGGLSVSELQKQAFNERDTAGADATAMASPPPSEPPAAINIPDEKKPDDMWRGGVVGYQSGGHVPYGGGGGGIFERLSRPQGPGEGDGDYELLRLRRERLIAEAQSQLSPEARMAMHHVTSYAMGGMVGGFADAVANAHGYAEGGLVSSKTGDGNTLSFHQLDIRTNAGTFRAGVSDDTMDSLRSSSLGGKLSQTGPRPTWYS